MMTYDRQVIRMNETMWKEETTKLYETAARRANATALRMRDVGAEGLQYGLP